MSPLPSIRNTGAFEQLFNAMSDASLIIKEGVFIECNPAAVALLGYPDRETLINTTPSQISPPVQHDARDSQEKAGDMMDIAYQNGSHNFDWTHLKYDGSSILVDVLLTPLVINEENYLHVIWRDMTNNISKQQAESMRQLIETMADAYLILRNGVYIQCNQAAADILGYKTKREVLHLGREHFSPEFQPDGKNSAIKAQEIIELTRQYGSYSCDWTYLKSDGSPLPTSVLMTRTEVDGDEILHIVWSDLSKRLEEQSDSVRQLLAKMGDASLLIKDNRYVDCNQAAADLLGYEDKQDILNIHPILISPKNQPDGRDSIEKANEIMSKGYTESSQFFEWMYLKKDGTPLMVDVILTPVTLNNEQHIHVIWRDITDRIQAQEKVERLAYEDQLTKLANRRSLVNRLQHLLSLYKRTHYKGALLVIDLDNFKVINDTLGHDIGDKVLKQVAKKITANVREGDTVSRFGGDEFVVMLEELDKDSIRAVNKAETACEKLLEALNEPYQIDDYYIPISASVGVSMFSEDSQASQLIQQSDIAMYQAKAAGRNAIRFFDPVMQEAVDIRARVETDIKEALTNNRFELYYQLQINTDGTPLGAEALLRLKHPELGFVPPMEYIPIAEETGLIVKIGNWVLETACEQIKAWQSSPLTRHLTIAINVSSIEFKEHNFVINVLNAIRKNDIQAHLLKLELTETMLVDDIESIIKKMSQLKEIGVQFSLDDFGTGYSSLQYLKRLPLNQLKIDQSFVRDLEDDQQDRSEWH